MANGWIGDRLEWGRGLASGSFPMLVKQLTVLHDDEESNLFSALVEAIDTKIVTFFPLTKISTTQVCIAAKFL